MGLNRWQKLETAARVLAKLAQEDDQESKLRGHKTLLDDPKGYPMRTTVIVEGVRYKVNIDIFRVDQE